MMSFVMLVVHSTILLLDVVFRQCTKKAIMRVGVGEERREVGEGGGKRDSNGHLVVCSSRSTVRLPLGMLSTEFCLLVFFNGGGFWPLGNFLLTGF